MTKEEALNILNNVVRMSLKSGVFEESADVSVIHQALLTFAGDINQEKEAQEAKAAKAALEDSPTYAPPVEVSTPVAPTGVNIAPTNQ